jgi:hypothetical protein
VGDYIAPVYQRIPYNSATANFNPPVPDNTPNFLAKFTTPVFQRIPYFTLDNKGLQPPQPETNTHFIAQFKAPIYQRALNSWDNQGLPQVIDLVGANPHFIGDFYPSIFQRIPYNSFTADFPPVPFVDQPVNFLGKFNPTIFYNSVSYFSTDTGVPFIPPPTPSFPDVGGKQWTKEAWDADVRRTWKEMGQKGGIARANTQSALERAALASYAALTRWKK